MKCQILFSRKNKKNITNLLSAEYAHSMVRFNTIFLVKKSALSGATYKDLHIILN